MPQLMFSTVYNHLEMETTIIIIIHTLNRALERTLGTSIQQKCLPTVQITRLLETIILSQIDIILSLEYSLERNTTVISKILSDCDVLNHKIVSKIVQTLKISPAALFLRKNNNIFE